MVAESARTSYYMGMIHLNDLTKEYDYKENSYETKMKKSLFFCYLIVIAALGVVSGMLIYTDNRSLWIIVVFILGLFVIPISIFKLFPRLKETTKGRMLSTLLFVMSILSPIFGIEAVFLFTTHIYIVESLNVYEHEKRIFTSIYNDSIAIGWGKVYVDNRSEHHLHLYKVCYGGGGATEEMQSIGPNTFTSIEEVPDYLFQEPPSKIFVRRRKGDNEPEWKIVLDIDKP